MTQLGNRIWGIPNTRKGHIGLIGTRSLKSSQSICLNKKLENQQGNTFHNINSDISNFRNISKRFKHIFVDARIQRSLFYASEMLVDINACISIPSVGGKHRPVGPSRPVPNPQEFRLCGTSAGEACSKYHSASTQS